MMTDNAKITKYTTAKEIVKFYKTDLTGKVVMITGCNTGIGLETARVLVSVGAKVILSCVTLKNAHGPEEEIKKSVHADLVPMQLADFSIIRCSVKSFLGLDLPLHILINNTGVITNERTMTKDGFENTFGIHYLGHFLLMDLLTLKIKASASSRIVIVASSGQCQFLSSDGIDFNDLNSEKDFSPVIAYGQSKLANIYHANELQRRFDKADADVIVISLHTGFIATNIGRTMSYWAI